MKSIPATAALLFASAAVSFSADPAWQPQPIWDAINHKKTGLFCDRRWLSACRLLKAEEEVVREALWAERES